MIPKKIEGTDWTVQDWDSQWPPVFSSTTRELTVEVDQDGDACVEFEHSNYRNDTVRCYIPLDVLAEVLRRNGYDVLKK